MCERRKKKAARTVFCPCREASDATYKIPKQARAFAQSQPVFYLQPIRCCESTRRNIIIAQFLFYAAIFRLKSTINNTTQTFEYSIAIYNQPSRFKKVAYIRPKSWLPRFSIAYVCRRKFRFCLKIQVKVLENRAVTARFHCLWRVGHRLLESK
jgi:hypothetical protein